MKESPNLQQLTHRHEARPKGRIAINCTGRVLLAAVLLVSGFSKLPHLEAFAGEVSQYAELYVSPVLVPWSQAAAVAVCCIELTLGALLPIARLSLYTSSATLGLLTFFLYLTTVNYLHPSPVGAVESCGCFGELLHFSPQGAFSKTLALWGVALLTFLTDRKTAGLLLKTWTLKR